jgi:hypothetical protein
MFTFIDYISAGIQLSFTEAIYFTGSNLDIKNRNSLHTYPKVIKILIKSHLGSRKSSSSLQQSKTFTVYSFGAFQSQTNKLIIVSLQTTTTQALQSTASKESSNFTRKACF